MNQLMTHALANVDLNLFAVFRAIDDTRHVTKAARALGISQPALSHALGRLRETLRDPLFVKTSKGMVPTPRAISLSEPIREALATFENDVLGHGAFDAKALSRTFRVRTTDFVESLLLPELATFLARETRGVRTAFMPIGFELPKDDLAIGACDLAIAGFFGALPHDYYERVLFDDTFACAFRLGHPRLGAARGLGRKRKALALRAYVDEEHVLVAPSGDLSGAVDAALAREGAVRRVVVGTSGFLSAGFLAANSDCVLTAPSRVLAVLANHLPLCLVPPPIALPPVRVVMAWHRRTHTDPGHAFFREAVARCMNGPL